MIEEFLKEFAQHINYFMSKYNNNFELFMHGNNKNNKQLHDAIVQFLVDRFESMNELKSFCSSEYLNKLDYRKFEGNQNLILTYLNNFIDSGYLKFKNGKVIDNINIIINPDKDSKYFQDKYNQNYFGNLPCFILPNGTCYFALRMHNDLAKWLHVNGIDISHALRFDQFKKNYEISFGISNDYNQYDRTHGRNPEYLELTQEQANTLAKLYKTINSFKKLDDIEDMILYSHGLGFRGGEDTKKGIKISKKNLSKLETAFGNYLDTNYINRQLKNRREFYM